MEQEVIVGNSLHAIVTIDSQDRIELWSPEAEQIFGWTAEEIEGLKVSETIFRKSVSRLYKSALEYTETSGDECTLDTYIEQTAYHQDGYKFPVEIFLSNATSAEGDFFILYARNITEQKEKENHLRNAYENQRVLNFILNLSLKPISLKNFLSQALDNFLSLKNINLLSKGGIFLTGQGSNTLTLTVQRGFSEEQIRSCRKIHPGRCHCGQAALTRQVQFSSGIDEKHQIHFSNMKPHGHYCIPILSGNNLLGVIVLYVEQNHKSTVQERENFQAVANIFAGIIERKKMEEQRAELIIRLNETVNALLNEKLFSESIIHNLSGGLIVLDLKGIITLKNPIAQKIFKSFSAGAAIEGKHLSTLLGIQAAREIMDLSSEKTHADQEIKLVDADSEEHVIRLNKTAQENSDGKKVGTIISFSDITELKRSQMEMEKMNHLITVAEIASAVAHEVRNPLAGIKTMSQAIEESLDEHDENREYLYRIIRQVDRLNKLLSNFFTYARPGRPQKSKISLEDIVDETRQLVRDKLSGKNIHLKENYESNLPQIFADPGQIQQVFLNLMLNSIDAVRENGIIEITARFISRHKGTRKRISFPNYQPHRDYIKIFFKDNGCGMNSEVHQKAFKPFFSTKPHGAGLGLAIVSRILNENNAHIYLDPVEHQGTTFIMFIETC